MTNTVQHVLLLLLLVRLNSCSNDIMLPGQARPDDPNACKWFEEPAGSSVYRCCDGFAKTNALDLTENCKECSDGSYGFFCTNNCTCENGGTCNKVDGSCICSAQYFGSSCQYSCRCHNGAACMSDGSCSCANGFYGELCDSKCLCSKTRRCDSKIGKCICQDGFYGDLCLPCNCSNTEQCDPFNGVCSCKPGHYGENCDKQCSCYNGAFCGNGHPGLCKCLSGWIGSDCANCDTEKRLSYCGNKCLHCYNGHKCSIKNGDCDCSPGWQGNRCDKNCNTGFYGVNCSEVCHCEHGSCNPINGTCNCDIGWTGKGCEIPCPENCVLCKGHVCPSCKSGWKGKTCADKCGSGFYGDACKETCQECNCLKSCHHVNGDCPNVVRCEQQKCKYPNGKVCIENPFKVECKDGWTGHFCDELTGNGTAYTHGNTTSSTDDINTKGTILVAIPVVVAALFLVVAVAVPMAKLKSFTSRLNARGSDWENEALNICKV